MEVQPGCVGECAKRVQRPRPGGMPSGSAGAGPMGGLSQGETVLVLVGIVVVCAVLFALIVCVCTHSAEQQA